MPFKKGQSGNPNGRPRGQKIFSDMLRLAINEAHEQGGNRLRAVADALVAKAMEGDVQAIRELADRLEGKVAQQLNHAGPDGEGPMQVDFNTYYDAKR